ncbi:MAG: tetratricopeptide repeat protein [Gammaproteobacteria bacterium]|jgi:tetratricopeptide (TPR) repeat protein
MSQYKTNEVAKLTGHEPETIRRISRMGILNPIKDKGIYFFSFQDISFLRAISNVVSNNENRYIWAALKKIKRQISADEPLSSLSFKSHKSQLIAKNANKVWNTHSGQYLLQFENQKDNKTSELSNPRDINEQFKKALALDEEKKFMAAKEIYIELLERDPYHARARINLGRIYHQEANFNNALQQYEKAIELEPKNVIARFNAGVAYEDLDNQDDAIARYLETLDLDITIAEAHFNLSRLYEAKNDIKASAYHLAYYQILKLTFDD